ncbi:MAG TPA: DUF302 domain-containing protein [Chthoniobacter sp.]|jgi:uncharacterized protein (DUF302 family)
MQEIPGIASFPSPYDVEATLDRLRSTIEGKGLTIFAHIDHAAGARAVGLPMPPAHVLIFGTAKAGTPLMVASPLLALDLPLRVLVWEDGDGKVWVSYRTPEALLEHHPIPAELVKNVSGVGPLIQAALG